MVATRLRRWHSDDTWHINRCARRCRDLYWTNSRKVKYSAEARPIPISIWIISRSFFSPTHSLHCINKCKQRNPCDISLISLLIYLPPSTHSSICLSICFIACLYIPIRNPFMNSELNLRYIIKCLHLKQLIWRVFAERYVIQDVWAENESISTNSCACVHACLRCIKYMFMYIIY